MPPLIRQSTLARSERSVGELSDPIATASLTSPERRVLRRFTGRLREVLGEDLRAVWLYGSRARGDAVLDESDPDRRSDVDLIVIVDSGHGWSPHSGEAVRLMAEAAEAEGESPVWYSVLVYDTDLLRERREIRSFYIQEVDRDKLVLYGSALK